jgi:pilus assembly protein Flp/PilA
MCTGLTQGEEAMTFYLWLKNRLESEDGQDLIEYALLVGLIVIIVIGAVTLAGTSVSTIFSNIATTLSGVGS